MKVEFLLEYLETVNNVENKHQLQLNVEDLRAEYDAARKQQQARMTSTNASAQKQQRPKWKYFFCTFLLFLNAVLKNILFIH